MEKEIINSVDYYKYLGFETWYDNSAGEQVISIEDAREAMIEFAKMHVQQALQDACDFGLVVTYEDDEDGEPIYEIAHDTVFNAYPLSRIK